MEDNASLIDVLSLLDRYRLRAHRMSRAQHIAAKRADAMNRILGVPVVALSALVGTSIFATLRAQPEWYWVVAAGFVALLASVLAALHTFLGYSEVSKRHTEAATAFGQLKREMDILSLHLRLALPDPNQGLEQLRPLVDRFSVYSADSPTVDDKLYDRAKREQMDDDEGI
ncbi:SLATT domain-containing protein [Nocardia pseudovaccinii]|uniref:SLATT domain-containing protein n=1 Tax=Nocardia pseudovaccinii TaxID=189540 RepID=UPI0012F4F549|nr:SLATT domain-containing protein [Nocardia pseudovaccinii]